MTIPLKEILSKVEIHLDQFWKTIIFFTLKSIISFKKQKKSLMLEGLILANLTQFFFQKTR